MKSEQIIPYFSVDDPYEIVYRKSSTSKPVGPHTHNALEIYFTLTDLPDVLLNDTVSSVTAGSLIVIPPHCIHQLFNKKLTVYERYIISINSQWISHVLDHSTFITNYSTKIVAPAIINLSKKQVGELTALLNANLSNNKDISITKLARFFDLLAVLESYITKGLSKEAPVSISKSQETVNAIIAYINNHITESVSIEEIAHEFHLNKDYMARLFKSHTHATIGHYMSLQKAGLAQSLLSEGYTVTEVQEKLGFTSYAYFFKFFKKMTGISPSHYRKA